MNTPSRVHIKSITDFLFFVVTLRLRLTLTKWCVIVWVLCVVCLVSMLAAWWYVDEESMFQASAVLWIDRDTASEWLWLTLLYSPTPLTRAGRRECRKRGRLREARNLLNVRIGAGRLGVTLGEKSEMLIWMRGEQMRWRTENRQWGRQTDGLIEV